MGLTRRAVLAAGAGAATLGFTPFAHAADETRAIPSTGARIPVVGLGTWITFNVGSDPVLLERSAAVTEAFFEEGGGVIDSSPMYGSAQATMGHVLAKLGRPQSLVATDKVWTRAPGDGPTQIEASRNAWGVPKFHILQVHNLLGWQGHLETLFAMKAAGALDHVGITTSHGRRHGELEAIMKAHPIDFIQLTYNVVDRAAEDRLLPLAQDKGIGVIVNRPFRRGDLIARVKGAPLPGFAAELGASTWAELMLKFIVSHPAVTVAIPATTNPAHVRQNKTAARTPLPDAAMRARIADSVAAM
ncbi:MAG: aldo/keto reductase [Pseudomonadota bacterium]